MHCTMFGTQAVEKGGGLNVMCHMDMNIMIS